MGRREQLAWAMLLFIAVAVIAPSFVGWHHDDDLQNMRWVIEYRDAPWRALTDRHPVHDHIRPATLWAVWLGAQISGGAWWGPQLISAVLLLGAWLGMASLAGRLAGSRLAALLAAALILDLEGFRMLLDWSSWINSAGELCCGLLGLLLVHRFLRSGGRSVHLGGALVLLACAGLFKEPGWVVYPGVAAAMCTGAWGQHRRSLRAMAGLLLLGLLGFAWSHHSGNVDRLGAELSVLHELQDLQHGLRPWVDVWPAQHSGSRGWKGVFLPLCALSMSGAIVLRRRPARTERQAQLIILGTAVLTGMGYVRPDWVGPMVGVGLLCLVWVHSSGLLALLAVLSCGVMFLFAGPNPVQILSAGMAFSALVAVHTSRLLGPAVPPALRLFAGLLLTVGLGHHALQLADRIESAEPSRRDVPGQLQAKNTLLAEGALLKLLERDQVYFSGELGPRVLGPLYGFKLVPAERAERPLSLQISGDLWLDSGTGDVGQVLLEGSLLGPVLTAGRPAQSTLQLSPGHYVAGIVQSEMTGLSELSVQADCMRSLRVQQPPAGTVWSVGVFTLAAECEVQVGAQGQADGYLLARLPEMSADLSGADFGDPLLGLRPVDERRGTQ
jgi:hypothetical protein